MTLFDWFGREQGLGREPLAARMRPRNMGEFIGQEHLLDSGKVLETVLRGGYIPSMVLWGPPGSGKTTLAYLIAGTTKGHFSAVSAVSSGVGELRQVITEANNRWSLEQRRTILFVDETHRFNKAQQDVILPAVENGTVTYIGATTENPSFEVVAPLLSRCRVFKLNFLNDGQIAQVVKNAIVDSERGLGAFSITLDPEAMKLLARFAGGDGRAALNGLELATAMMLDGTEGPLTIDAADMEKALQRRMVPHDKNGEAHYDTISAFIKSVRASDPDAAVYWLARMLEAGEDPLFIARRLVILASEDIGLADPNALGIAVAAQQALQFIGLPEGSISLAEVTIYLATAHKSNSAYVALNKALDEVRTGPIYPVPLYLRNAVTGLMRDFGYGENYRYAHDYPGHFSGQPNLPQPLLGTRYYMPTEEGYEMEISERSRVRPMEREMDDES